MYSTSATGDEFKSHFETMLSEEDEYVFSNDGFGLMHYCWIDDYYYKITLVDGVEYNEMLAEFGKEALKTEDDLIIVEITHYPK